MPLYDFGCPCCGDTKEHLMSYERSETVEIVCEKCNIAKIKRPSLIAKTATAWHSNWTEGMSSGFYSASAGRRVANKREEEKIMNAKGFVNEKELGDKYWWEDKSEDLKNKRATQDQKAATYKKVLTETGDATKAMESAFPAKECLDGTLDKLYSEKI
tara:strand:+ start:928 stop:1401 length:474 start_codon:yes stop_codon:yes gene_type:complete